MTQLTWKIELSTCTKEQLILASIFLFSIHKVYFQTRIECILGRPKENLSIFVRIGKSFKKNVIIF